MNNLLRIRIGMTSFSFPKRTADELKLCSVIGEVGLLHYASEIESIAIEDETTTWNWRFTDRCCD